MVNFTKNSKNKNTGTREPLAPNVNDDTTGMDVNRLEDNTAGVTGNEDQSQNRSTEVNLADKSEAVLTGPAANPAINSPTVTGFTAEDRRKADVFTAAEGQEGLNVLTLDEATKIRDALSRVIGYQTGSTYRHDYTSGLEELRKWGMGFDTDKADTNAMRVQNEVAMNEVSQVEEKASGEDNKE